MALIRLQVSLVVLTSAGCGHLLAETVSQPMPLIILQIGLLFLTSAGWGHLLRRALAGARRDTLARAVLYALAGFCLQIVLLQNLIYCRVPVRLSFPLPLLVGAFGCWCLVRHRAVDGERRPLRSVRWHVTAALLIVLALQGIGATVQGVSNYYGKAGGDQVRYVLLSEFLRTRSYGLTLDQIGPEPWLLAAARQQHL